MLTLDDAYEEAIRGAVWLERPPALRLVKLTGPQRVWFLQNTITADVDDVPSGGWVESCFLDPKGRVQAHFRAGFLDDEIWLDVEPDADRLATWFENYKFRTKVEIVTREQRCFTVLGPSSTALAGDGEVKLDGNTVAFGYSFGEVPAVDLHAQEPPHGVQAVPDLYDVVRVEAGVGRFGVDFGERDLPQEAGLTRVVSTQKGCYVGQETVARIHFRGHINKVLRPLRFFDVDADGLVGRELAADDGVVGRVTSAVRSPRSGVVGLAMARVEPPDGAELEVEGGGTATLGPVPEGTKVKTA
jgi:folate-binding protein YgfZ